ncbi:MAG: hypothetical protein KDA61_17705, partial [Planctomycetales bacterium]|nr:hypothetical protein [Planctomycetales bacterium]
MRILAVYRHYWPDATPYARLLRAIAEDAVANGRRVTVITAQPSYNDLQFDKQPRRETLKGVHVRRVRLAPERKRWKLVRLLNSIWFLCRAVGHAILGRYDLVVANGHPPVLMGVALRMIHLLVGTPYVLHLQDIHPEGLRAVGVFSRSPVYRTLRAVDAAVCRRAA